MDLEQNLGRISGVFDRSSVALTLADVSRSDQPLVLANEKFNALTGYPFSETVGRNCRFLQKDGENTAERAEILNAIRDRTEVQVVLRNYRKDGSAFDNLLFLNPIAAEGEMSRYMLGSQFLLNDVDRPVEKAVAHSGFLADDLERIGDTAEKLRMQRRRYMADAAAALVSAWARRV